MGRCSAFGCSNHSGQGFRVFCFPKDPQRRKDWAIKVRRDSWFPNDNSRLCEVHFVADQFIQREGLKDKKILKYDALPKIFDHQTKPPCARSIRNRSPPSEIRERIKEQIMREHDYAITGPIDVRSEGRGRQDCPTSELGEDFYYFDEPSTRIEIPSSILENVDPLFDVEVTSTDGEKHEIVLQLRESEQKVRELQSQL
eukprot:maker-scaffold20_size707684-snap-gene-3.12 protein:Tk03844 transcript:maker-scaffold20_size707684-snap-gene-3.12-mRNA-1 annotation:"52 kda repressor of the inhibitor of the protein kinase-like isoform x2"